MRPQQNPADKRTLTRLRNDDRPDGRCREEARTGQMRPGDGPADESPAESLVGGEGARGHRWQRRGRLKCLEPRGVDTAGEPAHPGHHRRRQDRLRRGRRVRAAAQAVRQTGPQGVVVGEWGDDRLGEGWRGCVRPDVQPFGQRPATGLRADDEGDGDHRGFGCQGDLRGGGMRSRDRTTGDQGSSEGLDDLRGGEPWGVDDDRGGDMRGGDGTAPQRTLPGLGDDDRRRLRPQ